MFGLGMGEIVIILVLALILLGPQKLPDAAKQLGKGLREFRRATEDLKQQFEGELYSEDKPSRPTLVDTPKPAPEATPGANVAPPAPVPTATAQNVPGLDAALVEPPAPSVPVAAAVESPVAAAAASAPAPIEAPKAS